ncbi:MAG: polyprenyl synthetase family protein [Syntrophomonadaceae bacterium]|nr:polyprenyl synthetase family protein [Syntrophomonadaceae bacterium]
MLRHNLFNLISTELEIVETKLTASINSNLDLLNETSTHLIKAGGKRLRPAFVLLAAKFYKDDLTEIIPIAVAVELIHMATLVHDDVIDNSNIRRGVKTVMSCWGNRMSIYTGNYIFARSLALVAAYGRRDIVDVLADASMKICEGEIIQMLSCYNVNLGLKNYLRRIERKTALLISLSCRLGAMISKAPEQGINALKLYGYYLGMAFQITDDILDFIAEEQVLGKPAGSDVKQGVITLPALYALKYDQHKAELSSLLSSPELCRTETDRIIDIVVNSDGIDYAYEKTRHFALKAQKQLNSLPDVPVKEALFDLADFILDRDY